MKTKMLEFAISDFKMDKEKGTFSCYGNIKGNIDHAMDRTLDGAYQKSIDKHVKNGTMPKMFWMHKSHELPVGVWNKMSEDSKGFYMEGRLSKTAMGQDIEILAKEGALDSFSIGYRVIKEQWNHSDKCNDLIELDIKEVSWVTFACNEESLLQGIKTAMQDGKLPSKADLREVLKVSGVFSKREIERITAVYNPVDEDNEMKSLLELLDSSPMFK
jgi:uncharacterized protein